MVCIWFLQRNAGTALVLNKHTLSAQVSCKTFPLHPVTFSHLFATRSRVLYSETKQCGQNKIKYRNVESETVSLNPSLLFEGCVCGGEVSWLSDQFYMSSVLANLRGCCEEYIR